MQEELQNINIDKIIDTIKSKQLISRYVTLIICLFFSSVAFNLLTLPSSIVTGGVNGLAVIFNHIAGIKPSVVIFVVSLVLLIFSYIYLGAERTSGTLLATIVYPIFVQFTSVLSDLIVVDNSDLLVISLFLGIIIGTINGFICKTGFSSGGIPALSQIIHQKTKLSIGTCNFVLNTIIVLFGASFFGWTMVMYSVIILYISGFVMDRVVLGISRNKAIYIITKQEEKIKKYVVDELHHTITEFQVKGAFLKKKRTCYLAVIPTIEYFRVKEDLLAIDPEAFMVVTDSYQVQGGR